MSIVAEAPGFIQVFSDGTIKRFSPQIATPSTLSTTYNYKFKDVTIDPSKPITARIFLPESPPRPLQSLLPVLVYFHGGGFCIGSTTWLGYHVFLGDLSATANAIILSVDYRLAPENKLPTAYEDCYTALQWLISKSEEWLSRADMSNVFLCGDSAGGNIAHQVAVNAIKFKNPIIRIKGMVLIHPYFGSESRTELELAEEESGNEVAMNDMFWRLSLPAGENRDFYGCNFEKGDFAEWTLFPEVMVGVAEKDFLKERGVMYAEFLKRKGAKRVSFVETRSESHVFHVWNPESEATRLLQKQMRDFMVRQN